MLLYFQVIKTGAQLRKEVINFGRTIEHPYIFFRAPFRYDGNIDYTSVNSEIASLYGNVDQKDKVFIRVDPNRTYVFSSEIRAKYLYDNRLKNKLQSSKIKLSEYLKIIRANENYVKNARNDAI